MLDQIKGLHHVTALASAPAANNAFWTRTLGLRRVKTTVNFDSPDVYHLYFGDAAGTPGTVMTYFPRPHSKRGTRGTGEVALTAFSIPPGTAATWAGRLDAAGVQNIVRDTAFGAARVLFDGPDGERLALVEAEDDRAPWTTPEIDAGLALRGLHSVVLHLAEADQTAALLRKMGYAELAREGDVTRYALPGGGPARVVDILPDPGADRAHQGAGSVHHIAFAVENRARQAEVRETLLAAGWKVTEVKDRDYFWAIYFRSPGGVLFEVATNEPGFAVDEDPAHLGEALRLPARHEHLREKLETTLAPLD
ncbi:MAG: ring-cleaving dioxygenase [Limimaricola sp.]|uniref:ring-cleaving dioxygenase n=1 Tax=Limimaricola sp. TaxID=2211665 RepID=UPI001DDC5101|nr:ring-cleaving dioxygenase [Limimaricola sp.]MBI1416977.1 ring-cleaving dioxygenase [Limimaricola sp.]